MPFRNQTINTTNINSTELYGDIITSGGTDIALFSYNRMLHGATRAYRFSTGTTNVETFMESFSFTPGTLNSNSVIEFFASWEQVSTNSSGKLTRWRFGSANTSSDGLVMSNSSSVNGTTSYITWFRVTFINNSSAHILSYATSNFGFLQSNGYAPISGFDLSGQTTYLSVSTQRPGSTDVICLKNCDVFIGKL